MTSKLSERRPSVFARLMPMDKLLSPDWIASLTARGAPSVWKGEDLPHVGMPVGGIGCGQLYQSGEGRLWLWNTFKSNYDRESVGDLRTGGLS